VFSCFYLLNCGDDVLKLYFRRDGFEPRVFPTPRHEFPRPCPGFHGTVLRVDSVQRDAAQDKGIDCQRQVGRSRVAAAGNRPVALYRSQAKVRRLPPRRSSTAASHLSFKRGFPADSAGSGMSITSAAPILLIKELFVVNSVDRRNPVTGV